MTDKYTPRLLAFSFYGLALGIFVSVSVIPIYHIFTILAFLLFLKNKKINFKTLPTSAWALIAFVLIQLISGLINFTEMQDVSRSFGTLKYPLMAVIGLLLFQKSELVENDFLKRHAKYALNLFLFSIILAFSYDVIKIYSGLDYFKKYYEELAAGTESTRFAGFSETMRYGYGTALAILVVLACLVNWTKIKFTKLWFLLLTFVIGFTGMYLSYTRGALLAILIGIPVVLYFYNRRATLAVSIISFIILSSLVIIALMGGSNSSRFFMKADSKSNQVRIAQYWAAAYEIKEKPILGYGPQQFKHHSKEMKIKHNLGFEDFDSHAHNIFLQIGADSGILGLAAFLIWLGLWLKETLTLGNNFSKQVFLPTILFLLVAGQFEMLFMAQTSTLIYFIYALSGLNIFKKETT